MSISEVSREFASRCAWSLAKVGELIQDGRNQGWLPGPPLKNVQSSSNYLADAQEFAASKRTPAHRLSERLQLSSREMDVMWFLCCLESEPILREIARELLLPSSQTVSLATVDRMLGDAAGEVRLAKLVELGLIDVEKTEHAPRFRRGVRATDTLFCFLRTGSWPLEPEPRLMDPRLPQGASVASVVAAVEAGLRSPPSVVVLKGTVGSGRISLVLSVVSEIGVSAKLLGPSLLESENSDDLRSAMREVTLRGQIAVFTDVDARHAGNLEKEILRRHSSPIVITSSDPTISIRSDRPVVVVEMPPPTTTQRAELWKRGLEVCDSDADLLAERYPLAPGLIVRASEAAKAKANGRKLAPDDVYAGIRAVLDDKLGAYAKRVTVTQTWDDLVLPQDQIEPIVELMARVRGRRQVYEQWGFAAKIGKGLGVSALFSGPPGTGKTMVAALIAKELGLELYQVDMAKLVSKYIGETEKHLSAMFDAAEAGHAILLFDECDSLFGRRTEVRSSNDRYANLETNYLLQRLESFTGICLLTTNHESNLDPAFHRRLSLHVRFDLPDERERAKLWRAVLPAAAPVGEDVDFAGLARRYEMSGGYIKNAALRAAFLAADENASIGAAHLERAARVEYEAMGKLAA